MAGYRSYLKSPSSYRLYSGGILEFVVMRLIYLAKSLYLSSQFFFSSYRASKLVRTTGVAMNDFPILQKTSSGLYLPVDCNVGTTGLYTLPDWDENVPSYLYGLKRKQNLGQSQP